MVGVPFPGNNRLLAGPIRNRDANAICTAHALYAKKTGLRSRIGHAEGRKYSANVHVT